MSYARPHQTVFHTYHDTDGRREGTLYLAPARKAWLARNELASTPTPIVLFEVTPWREERLNLALQWSESTLSFALCHHPFTRIQLPKIDLLAPLMGGAEWTLGVGEANLALLSQRAPSRHSLATLTRWSGHAALSFSVALMLLFAGPVVVLQTQDLLSQAQALFPQAEAPGQHGLTLPEPSASPTPEPSITSAEDIFSLQIPDLDISSTITPNVDPASEKEYTAALKNGIAHAAGTALPQQFEHTKTIYLFAHSTDAPWNIARYNAQFYALKDAQPGQKITLRFWGENREYTIEEIKIIEATDVTALTPQFDREQLVLQTCYPPGTAWKRLLVIAVPSSESANLSEETPSNASFTGPEESVL